VAQYAACVLACCDAPRRALPEFGSAVAGHWLTGENGAKIAGRYGSGDNRATVAQLGETTVEGVQIGGDYHASSRTCRLTANVTFMIAWPAASGAGGSVPRQPPFPVP
jgi:hypothetical protein